MKNKVPTALLMTIALCTLAIGTTFAQDRVPGVSVGNEFTYSQKSLWISSDPSVPMPAGLTDINMTEYYRVTVTAVSGSNVSTHIKWHFTNGTDVETDGSVSIETTEYQGGYWAIIARNLNVGDRVHPNFPKDQSMINETVMWDYQSYKREANHLILDFTYEETNIPGSTYTEHVSTYFDRQTGALIQLEDTHEYRSPDVTMTVTWTLISQNAWTGAENEQGFTVQAITAIVVVVSVVAVLAVLAHYRNQSKKRENDGKTSISNFYKANRYTSNLFKQTRFFRKY